MSEHRLLQVASCAFVGSLLLSGCKGGEGSDADAGGSVDAPVPDAAAPDAAVVDAWDSDAGPCVVTFDAEIGFGMPTAVTHAYEDNQGVWIDQGPADWSCLGTPGDDEPTSVGVALSGKVVDFQTLNPVAGDVAAFADGDLVTPIATSTSSASGDYAVNLPVGVVRPAVRITSEDALDTYTLDIPLVADQASQQLDLTSVSQLTANALPAFIGISRTPGRALAMWQIVDCGGHAVGNAIATVSSTLSCPLPVGGADTYYFSAGSTSLPVRHGQKAASNSDGRFMVVEMEPQQPAFVQVWGYVDGQTPGDDPITLLAQRSIPLLADTFANGTAEPLRTE